LEQWRAVGDASNIATTLNNMGYLLTLRGRYDDGRAILEEGLDQAQRAGHRVAEANLRDSLGGLLLATGDTGAAMQSYQVALEIASDAGDLWAATTTAEGAGLCAVLQGDLDAAERWFERGEALADRQQSEYRRLLIAVGRGVLFLQAGQVDRALTVLSAVASELERLETRRDLVRARLWLAHAHHRRGDRRAAGSAFQQAAADATELNLPALLDVPARWDTDAFADFPAGSFASLQAETIARVRSVRPSARPVLLHPQGPPRFRAFSFSRARLLTESGAGVEWGREKARELFFYLLHTGAVRSGRVVADLWPETGAGRARASLYSAVYALRRATGPDVVQAEDRTYGLRPESVPWHDVAEFDRLYSLVRVEDDPARRTSLMAELVALYTGPLLDDMDADWASDLRRTYETRYLDTLESLVEAHAADGDWNACLTASLKGLAADPDCQTFYAHAERAYRAIGKPWAATRLARRARQRSTGTHGG
jgi:DNA-binding SARP family transcriptional activator